MRYKTLPARAARPHFRYKTLHAHPPSPHVRDKTLPAHPKWPNLAQSTHAGRVLYRFHHQEAEQGEFCTEHEAELGLATTPQLAPQVRKEPEQPQDRDAAPAGGGRASMGWQGQHGLAGPPPAKFRMQFPPARSNASSKTAEYQRLYFNTRNTLRSSPVEWCNRFVSGPVRKLLTVCLCGCCPGRLV